MPTMFPLLLVALLIWAGIWAFTFALDRRVAALERRVGTLTTTSDEGNNR